MKTTVGKYLISRLRQAGVKHVFGIPGDYVLGFYDLIVESPLKLVGTCTEAGAAFATDGYARLNGLGVVCVTYAVGGLNTVNAVAGAYAEKSPIIVISGAPGLDERKRTPLLHHRIRDFNAQRQIFEKITVAAVAIEDPATAPHDIDEAIAACVRNRRPVYIELPRDIVNRPCAAPKTLRKAEPKSDPETLKECLDEAGAMLKSAKRPAILGGVEVHRFGLQNSLLKLVERSGYPVAATLLGKSIITERHAQYLGIYGGAMGRDDVRRRIERADCLLILGAFMTDVNLGMYTADLDVSRTINATSEKISIKHHDYGDVTLKDFMDGLAKRLPKRRPEVVKKPKAVTFRAQPKREITISRFFKRMDTFLEDGMIVITDVGDCLFGAADVTIHRRTEFLSPAYYTSMGFAIPAAIGAQTARPDLRPLIFVGDGAFQMSSHELSVIVRQGLNPIVFVLNNKGYTTERFINEGPYNDIHNWEYHQWPQLLRAGWGCEVKTEGDLEENLRIAKANTASFSILNIHLDPRDRSEALARFAVRLARQAGLKG